MSSQRELPLFPALIFSNKIKQIPHLHNFLPDFVLGKSVSRKNAVAVIGWGYKPTAKKAREYAIKNNLSYVALEDGFLRSAGLSDEPPLSIVADDKGIYYDCSSQSFLERLILNITPDFEDELYEDAARAADLIRHYGISKYNNAPDVNLSGKYGFVLVIDQTENDASVIYAKANTDTFSQMINTALEENPDDEIWIKTHPEVLAGKKKSYIDYRTWVNHPRVKIISESVAPHCLLRSCKKVYTVSSQMGFEALIYGRELVTFGATWYCGWGLTDDRHPFIAELVNNENRRQKRSFLQVFAAAYLQYPRYINPETGERSSIFAVLEYLIRYRNLAKRLAGDFYCVNLSMWKQAAINSFFALPQTKIHFLSSPQDFLKLPPAQENAKKIPKLLIWGDQHYNLIETAKAKNFHVWKMEDGFLRSIGLGSNLYKPCSLVVDDLGIYFDSSRESRLEKILNERNFSEEELVLAHNLRIFICENSLTKYNVSNNAQLGTNEGFIYAKQIKTAANAGGRKRKIILVPGQVEDDASIKLGANGIFTNADLLSTVRRANPDAFIIYKPHPDIESGNRKGEVAGWKIKQHADVIARNADILLLISIADEVHTITSLSGFEAMIRGKKVYCYGVPFYAGWGISKDMCHIPERRKRRRNIDELTAAVLLEYPIYIDPKTNCFISAFRAAEILKLQKQNNNHGIHNNYLQKQTNKLIQLIKTINLK